MKKSIKIKFVDFWSEYKPQEHFLYQVLEKKYNLILSDNPDYLFFSVHGEEHLKYNDCIKIFYTGENLCPDFNVCDYAIGFEYLEYQDRYFRLPNYYNPKYKNDIEYIINKKKFTRNDLNKKEGFCSFVYSNGNANEIREKFFDKLSKYKIVSSGGKFRNNVGGPVANKIEFQKKYKFCLAFENSSHSGYTTEKIVQAYASDAIPIYWGDPDISKIFNSKSFINVNDFSSIEEAIEYVKTIDSDDNKYIEMINEPVFVSQRDFLINKMEDFSLFLYNIFDQNKKNAYRYNRFYWGKMYINKQIEYKKAYNRSFMVVMKRVLKKFIKK